MNAYKSLVKLASLFISPALPVVKRLFGGWHIDEFVDDSRWLVRHPSLILSTCRGEYDRDVALLTVDLLRRWVYSVYSSSHEVSLPSGFESRSTISYMDGQPPIISLVIDEYNTAYVLIRGTFTFHDVLVSTWDTRSPGLPPGPSGVHSGYLYVADTVFRRLFEQLEMLKPNDVVVAGHSMGAAVGILLSQQLWLRGYSPIVYSYGIPRFTNGDEVYPFPINSIICSEDSVSLGNIFPKYRHVGRICLTSGVTNASHTIDSYYSSVFFDSNRSDDCTIEDMESCDFVD